MKTRTAPTHRADGEPDNAWRRYGARVRRRDATLRSALTHGVVRAVVGCATLTAALAGTGAFGDDILTMLPAPGPTEASEPPTPAQAQAAKKAEREAKRAKTIQMLVAANDCYYGVAPDPTVEPRWAVVTLPGEDPALLPSTVGFGIWLEGDPGSHHAFCP